MAASMIAWTLDSLLADYVCEPLPPIEVTGISLDTRLLERGDIYLAVSGSNTHGLQFVQSAVDAGAVSVLCSSEDMCLYEEVIKGVRLKGVPVLPVDDLNKHCAAIASRFYGAPDQSMTLIAVTGTDGKTSVCRFIAQALSAIDKSCGYIGTLGWGLNDELHPTQLTTPDAVSLLRILASLKDQGASFVALEASSHGLAEGRLDGLSLDVAVLTNLGRDHLDYHKTIEAYRFAKAGLFAWPSLAAIVVNGCDEFGLELLGMDTEMNRFAYFSDGSCKTESPMDMPSFVSVSACHIKTNDDGLQFELSEGNAQGVVKSPLLGGFNVDNLLACYGSLRACGIAANQARHGLAAITAVTGRMERFGAVGRPTVVVDFSHTPQALTLAIDAARVHCKGKLWVVFGCGGDRDPGKRAPMAAAAERADHVVLTDDNPRTERSEDIINDARKGFRRPAEAVVIADRASAIRHAIRSADQNDLVLIAGKGHEDYQIIGITSHPFSDRTEALAALELTS